MRVSEQLDHHGVEPNPLPAATAASSTSFADNANVRRLTYEWRLRDGTSLPNHALLAAPCRSWQARIVLEHRNPSFSRFVQIRHAILTISYRVASFVQSQLIGEIEKPSQDFVQRDSRRRTLDENDEASLLKDIVATIITDKQGRARIDPSEVASEAMVILDPEGKSPQLVRHACELQLRRTATRMMDEEDEASRLMDIVAKIIVGEQDRTRVNPSEVASEAMVILDPEGKPPQLIRQACELQLLKTAERMLGQSDDEDESDDIARPRPNSYSTRSDNRQEPGIQHRAAQARK